jgi:2',3'-cyclic-nucleotide 2'-phosphodiesterase (5'-nucleotidase family)
MWRDYYMQKLIILHSNDTHGRIEGLARIATLVERTRAENPEIPVLYLDAGDCEETSVRLSNLTKGVGMYRLLRAAGCAVSTIGNGGLIRYSHHILPEYARAAGFPLLLANLLKPDGTLLDGVQASTILTVGSLKLGIVGLTATRMSTHLSDNPSLSYDVFGLTSLPPVPLVRELADSVRQQGADVAILLSHLGLSEDAAISLEAYEKFPLIIGAHTHNLIPAGAWSGKTLIAQAGMFAENLGRLDLAWDGTELHIERVSMIPVTEDILPAPRVLAEIAQIEAEIEQMQNHIIGELSEPLDFSDDRECGTTNLMADALRARTGAEVGLVTTGVALQDALPAGPIKRMNLWEICPSPGNPGIVEMTGEQLLHIVKRGLDPVFAAERPRSFRGRARGLIHLSGASMRAGRLFIGNDPVEPTRIYRVGGSDWELDNYGGYAQAAWGLQPSYEIQTILREVVEDYLKDKGPVAVEMGRIE